MKKNKERVRVELGKGDIEERRRFTEAS